MVKGDAGQLYTIEGIAAALIMLVSAWIVLNTTTIYTPGDTHVSDMQLEQLGTDALAMMDTPNTSTDYSAFTSDLQKDIKNNISATAGPANFSTMFLSFCDSSTGKNKDRIQYKATVYYRVDTMNNLTQSYLFNQSRNLTPGDHAVRVTRWVYIDNSIPSSLSLTPANTKVLDQRQQEVLLEVLLWRG